MSIHLQLVFTCFDIGVEFFLAISAIGLYFSLSRDSDIKHFYKRRVYRILPEYVIIGTIYFIIKAIQNHWELYHVLYDISFLSFFREGTMYFWFILEILFCYGVMPILFRLKKSITTKKYALFTLLILIAFYSLATYFDTIAIALFRFPVFCVSLILADEVYNSKTIPITHVFCASLVCLIFFIITIEDEMSFISKIPLYFIAFAPFLLSCSYLLRYLKSKTLKTLRFLGTISLELYLIHEHIFFFIWHHGMNVVISAIMSIIISIPLAYTIHNFFQYKHEPFSRE